MKLRKGADVMERKHLGFVVLTWNSQNCIGNCIKSIQRMNSHIIVPHIAVIDNGSSDNTVKIIKDVFAEAESVDSKLFELDKNWGTTYSRNIGVKHFLDLKIDYICILDSDTEVNATAMENLIAVLEENPKCGIVGPRMHDRNYVYQRSGRQIPTLTEKVMKVVPIKALQQKGTAQEAVISASGTGSVEVGYLMSACWMMKSSLFHEIGLLDEKIFYAPEDVDFCIRSWKAGKSIRYCYDADILHEWQRLSRKKLFSKHNYEHLKGLAYMFAKHKYLFNSEKFMR